MQLGIFAKTFPGATPALVMAAAAAAGFATVQYNMACSGLAAMPDDISTAQAAAVADASRLTGVSVAAVSGTYNMIHPDHRVRGKGLARLQVLAASCGAMGTGLITLCTGTCDADDQWRHHADNNSADAWRDLLGEMEKAIAIAEAHNVVLGIEPELANVVSSATKAKLLLTTMNSSRVKIVLDAANLFEVATLGEQHDVVKQAVDLLGEDIAMAHAKDRTASGDFVAAGLGVLDYDHYLKALKSISFAGPLVTHGLTADEALQVAPFLRNKLHQAGL